MTKKNMKKLKQASALMMMFFWVSDSAGNQRDYVEWQEGNSERKGQSLSL
jgi:hypothetical protein